LRGRIVQKKVVVVQVDGGPEDPLRCADAGHVVDVGVRQKDVSNVERLPLDEGEKRRDLVAGIDEHRLARVSARHDEAVLEERRHGLRFNYDHAVILAILDDLMFTSRIKTTASQLGVAVAFARSADAALAEMRKRAPSLVIFDLNSARTDPLGTVATMKQEPALRTIPTLGFVSHVQADLIESARRAGIDEVLARSAFTMRLGEILGRASGERE
jgi:CheY-like chemotaxis protein